MKTEKITIKCPKCGEEVTVMVLRETIHYHPPVVVEPVERKPNPWELYYRAPETTNTNLWAKTWKRG